MAKMIYVLSILIVLIFQLSTVTSEKWCMAKPEATNEQLQSNIDWVCSQGIDCKPISPGGACFDNNNIKTRSMFAMNAFYQHQACSDKACDFSGSGIVTTTNPSTETCNIPSTVLKTGKKWCVPKPKATNEQLQSNIDWVCSQGIDCKPISPGGACFDNNNIKTRSTFAMNAFYQHQACSDKACDFSGSGIVTTTNPSTKTCSIPSTGLKTNKKWCVPKPKATNEQLQSNIDWVCSQDIDCKPISPGGACFDNNNIKTRSTYVMNAFYQHQACSDKACDFSGSGIVTTTNPSTKTCSIPSTGLKTNKKWCVPKPKATNEQLQSNIDWVCSQDIDCKPISPGGACFDNNNIKTRSTYVMNAFYQHQACSDKACDFSGSGIVTTTNPSTDTCSIPSTGLKTDKKWCVPKPEATDVQLRSIIDWVCNHGGIDCKQAIFFRKCLDMEDNNNNLKIRATFIMNIYYKSQGYTEEACDFSGSGMVTTNDPSTKTCRIPGGGVKGCGY